MNIICSYIAIAGQYGTTTKYFSTIATEFNLYYIHRYLILDVSDQCDVIIALTINTLCIYYTAAACVTGLPTFQNINLLNDAYQYKSCSIR